MLHTHTHILTASLELDEVPLYRPSRFQTCGSLLLAVQLGLCVSHHIQQNTDLQAVGPSKVLYIPNPMKVNDDSEILALQSPGSFPRREEYKTSVAILLWL